MTNKIRKVIESGETYKDFLIHQITKTYHHNRFQGAGEHQALKDTLEYWLKNNPAVSENKN